jgi:ABC-type Fe3+ transport system permease subunit
MITDFLIYVTHNFLLVSKRLNTQGIQLRCKNIVSIIISLTCMSLFTTFYMVLISTRFLTYNKFAFFSIILILCITIILIILRKYSQKRYEYTIKIFSERYRFGKVHSTIAFLICFFTPILFIGVGLVLLRHILY